MTISYEINGKNYEVDSKNSTINGEFIDPSNPEHALVGAIIIEEARILEEEKEEEGIRSMERKEKGAKKYIFSVVPSVIYKAECPHCGYSDTHAYTRSAVFGLITKKIDGDTVCKSCEMLIL